MQCMECLEDIATSELLAGLALSDHSEDARLHTTGPMPTSYYEQST
jgi:hypothetical protein